MVRYYANIVGKYGAVQKALSRRLSGVPLEMICSTHGPVWKDIAKVIGIYDKLSRYEAEEVSSLLTGMYGHTAQMAEENRKRAGCQRHKKYYVHDVSVSDKVVYPARYFSGINLDYRSPTYNTLLFDVELLVSALHVSGNKITHLRLFRSYSWACRSVKG